MTEPWSSNTVEADPADSDEVLSARMWAVALENRLAEVRQVLTGARDTSADRRCRIRQAVRLIDQELAADA